MKMRARYPEIYAMLMYTGLYAVEIPDGTQFLMDANLVNQVYEPVEFQENPKQLEFDYDSAGPA